MLATTEFCLIVYMFGLSIVSVFETDRKVMIDILFFCLFTSLVMFLNGDCYQTVASFDGLIDGSCSLSTDITLCTDDTVVINVG